MIKGIRVFTLCKHLLEMLNGNMLERIDSSGGLIMDKVGDGNAFKILTTMKNNRFINNVGLFNESTARNYGGALYTGSSSFGNGNKLVCNIIHKTTQFIHKIQRCLLNKILNVIIWHSISIQYMYCSICSENIDIKIKFIIHKLLAVSTETSAAN